MEVLDGVIQGYATLDDEGNISNYRFSGGGGEITITRRNGLQKSKDEETEEIKEQERNQRLAGRLC